MKTDYETKDISNADIAPEPKKKLIEFNFPEHGITVEAANLEEAEEKLKKLIKQ
jgi:hypothetical protein